MPTCPNCQLVFIDPKRSAGAKRAAARLSPERRKLRSQLANAARRAKLAHETTSATS